MSAMKLYFLFITFFLGTLIMSVSAQTPKQKVAVYVTGDAENGYKKVISSKLVTGITHSDGYTAIERTADFLAELNKEHDYGMSGAVRDSQIARLGQQFGVQYVLVADISEVFESMFISARMIDVETARIINSTEASGGVSNLEDLSKLAGNIVLEILGDYVGSEAIQQRRVSTFDDLFYLNPPDGYHIATDDEVEKIINKYQAIGKELDYPIYTNVAHSLSNLQQNYTVRYTWIADGSSTVGSHNRSCTLYKIFSKFIKDSKSRNELNLKFCNDVDYKRLWNDLNFSDSDCRFSTKGLVNMSIPKPIISSGYVIFIKNK